MKLKLKKIIIFLSIVAVLALGGILKEKILLKPAKAQEYNCSSAGIAQMTKQIEQLTETMKGCKSSSCLINVKNQLLEVSSNLQKCGEIAQQKKQELAKEAQTLRWKINYLDASINEKQANIFALNTQISFLTNEIININYEIEKIKKEIENKRELISYSLRKIYEYDRNNLALITLAQGEFSDFFNEVLYIENLQKKISQSIAELRKNKETLENKKAEMNQKKKEIETAKIQIAQQVEILNYERQEKNNLLTITEGNEAKYEALMAEVERKTKEIYEQIYILESKLRSGASCSPNSLSWPVEGGLFTQGYGCLHTEFARKSYPLCDNRRGGFHNGIDIASSCGTPIKAPADGVVVATGNMGEYAYGIWMVLKHDIGIYTLYAHLQSINASGRVVTGQVIARMGTTGFSTGCHLHFMVGTAFTQNGNLPLLASQNPLCYLK